MINFIKRIYERFKFNTPTSQGYELVNRGIKSIKLFQNKQNGGLTVLLIPLEMHERKLHQHEIDLEDFTNEELRSRYRFGQDSLFTKIQKNDSQRDTKRKMIS